MNHQEIKQRMDQRESEFMGKVSDLNRVYASERVGDYKELISLLFDDLFKTFPQLNEFQWRTQGFLPIFVKSVTVNHEKHLIEKPINRVWDRKRTDNPENYENIVKEICCILEEPQEELYGGKVPEYEIALYNKALLEAVGEHSTITCSPGKIQFQ